jgi:capsular exopolysaccharide synthesis family protein
MAKEISDKSRILVLKRDIKKDYFYDEAIKTLRTNLQFCGRNIKTIMFTSALPNEGKSDIAFSLAISMASIGKNVLFIDADIRKSVLASRYNVGGNIRGLSELLSGQADVGQVLYKTHTQNLDVIFAGPYSPNPAELLEEDVFRETIKNLREEYDYLIIDTPPMANLIDAAIIAANCDGAVIVIESGTASCRLEQKVKEQIENSGCRILGVVLNKVDRRYDEYYGKYEKYDKSYESE